MDSRDFQTPVILIIFNRPDKVQQSLSAIRQVKPKQLLIAADGPRVSSYNDIDLCAAARKVIDSVDWDCEVYKNYAESNIGCANRIVSGLSWAFSLVDRAIILEDDCIPNYSFFLYCQELLTRFETDNRVMSISGHNVLLGQRRENYFYDYYFSRYPIPWGWATWKRAWELFDFELSSLDEVYQIGLLNDILFDPHYVKIWKNIFQAVLSQKIDAWDFRWTLSCWVQNGLSISPTVNLVTNIGYGQDSTHTNNSNSPYSRFPSETLKFPLKHPHFLVRDDWADDITQNLLYDYHPKLLKKINRKLLKLVGQRKSWS